MDFRTQVVEEKKRLSQQRRDVQKRVSALEAELSALGAEMKGVDSEIAAIEAYESATGSERAPVRRRTRQAAAPARKTRRGRKVSRRAEILSAVASFGATGAGRADIIQVLNVKGDKSAEQSVSNALAALKKSGELGHGDGKYIAPAAAASEPETAPEEPSEAKSETAAPKSDTAAPKSRRRRTSRRAAIVSIIEAAGGEGVGRSGIIEQLNVKGDKSAEQSVSNALANLKKSGAVAHGDGKYSIAS